jgi:hypothetical protein
MALDALWAVLIPEVSGVSKVQAPVHAGLRDTPAVLPEVSRVSSNDRGGPGVAVMGGAETPDTPPENVRYQAQPALALSCTLDTFATPEKINTEARAANELLSGELLTTEPTEPKRLFRQRWPWLTCTEQSAAQTYHVHHFNCHTCISAGHGRSVRCAVGLALWNDYNRADNLQTEGSNHGQA